MNTTEKLAIHGGAPAITADQTEASRWPIVGQQEMDAVAEATLSGGWSDIETAIRLEEQWAAYIGVRYALAHNNGTSALHAALFGVGVVPGDEVIVQSALKRE